MKHSDDSENLINIIRDTLNLNNIIQIKNPHDPFTDFSVKYWHKCFTNCGDVDSIMLHNLNDSDWITLEPQLEEIITYIEKEFDCDSYFPNLEDYTKKYNLYFYSKNIIKNTDASLNYNTYDIIYKFL